MNSLIKIISKNIKLLIRSKSSALIIILGPLLVIFLVGVAFDNLNKYSLNIGTYSDGYSDLSESFIAKLRDKNFNTNKIPSQQECIEQIKLGKIHTCIVFPKELTLDADKMNEIVFYVDNSKINLIWMVVDTLSTKISERSNELSMELTNILLAKLDTTKTELYNKKPTIVNLKTENQEIIDRFNQLQNEVVSVKMGELKQTSEEIRNYTLTKIIVAKALVPAIQSGINELKSQNNSSSTSYKFTKISNDVGSINTLLYNIQSKIEDPQNLSEADWQKINRLLSEIESNFTSALSRLRALSDSSSKKLNDVQQTVDKIYDDINSIQIKNAATIVNPITTNIKPIAPEKSYLNYMFPALIVLVVMFISILLSTTIIMMEKHSPAYFRNFITPTKDIVFIMATYITNILLVFIQLTVIIIISAYFFKTQIIPNLYLIVPILFLITSLFTFIGMLIGYLFTSEETATLASISAGSIMLFLSNIILPIESMPSYIIQVARYNPFVMSEEILRKLMLFQADFSSISFDVYILLACAAVIFIIIWILQKSIRRNLIHRLSVHHKNKPQIVKK